MPSKLQHRHIKRDAGPQAGLLEDHTHHLTFKDRLIATGLLFFLQTHGNI
jgi:hypothetical protein